MAIEVFNRYEKKYMLDKEQYEAVINKMSSHMEVDAYNKDNKFYMMEDDSRDQYRDTKDEDYYEYTFKYMKLFEENKKTYVYLLDDDNVTLEELNYSLLSSQISDWIPYGFVFYYK